MLGTQIKSNMKKGQSIHFFEIMTEMTTRNTCQNLLQTTSPRYNEPSVCIKSKSDHAFTASKLAVHSRLWTPSPLKTTKHCLTQNCEKRLQTAYIRRQQESWWLAKGLVLLIHFILRSLHACASVNFANSVWYMLLTTTDMQQTAARAREYKRWCGICDAVHAPCLRLHLCAGTFVAEAVGKCKGGKKHAVLSLNQHFIPTFWYLHNVQATFDTSSLVHHSALACNQNTTPNDKYPELSYHTIKHIQTVAHKWYCQARAVCDTTFPRSVLRLVNACCNQSWWW